MSHFSYESLIMNISWIRTWVQSFECQRVVVVYEDHLHISFTTDATTPMGEVWVMVCRAKRELMHQHRAAKKVLQRLTS